MTVLLLCRFVPCCAVLCRAVPCRAVCAVWGAPLFVRSVLKCTYLKVRNIRTLRTYVRNFGDLPEKSDFFLDALAEGFEFKKEDEDFEVLLRILYKDISLDDKLSFGHLNSTIINNINGLPPLVKGETHSEGGPMEKLLNRFPCKRIICSTCNVSKLSWRFSKDCCYECKRRDFHFCSTCRVSKKRTHFTIAPRFVRIAGSPFFSPNADKKQSRQAARSV